jgi:hypothetical protein
MDSDINKAIAWISSNLKTGKSFSVSKPLFIRLKQLDKKLFLKGIILTYFDYNTVDKWTRIATKDYSVKLTNDISGVR